MSALMYSQGVLNTIEGCRRERVVSGTAKHQSGEYVFLLYICMSISLHLKLLLFICINQSLNFPNKKTDLQQKHLFQRINFNFPCLCQGEAHILPLLFALHQYWSIISQSLFVN